MKMTFNDVLAKVKEVATDADLTGKDFLAVQVNLTGKEGGVFYVEIKDGKVSVEPYEYNDRNCALTLSLDDFNKLLNGKLDPVFAFTAGKLKVDGDVGKALEFSKLLR